MQGCRQTRGAPSRWLTSALCCGGLGALEQREDGLVSAVYEQPPAQPLRTIGLFFTDAYASRGTARARGCRVSKTLRLVPGNEGGIEAHHTGQEASFGLHRIHYFDTTCRSFQIVDL